jgi:hypothetical protein
VALIVVLEAGPVYVLVMAELRGMPVTTWQWVFVAASFSAVLVLMALAVFKPMKMGLRALSDCE